MTRAAKFRKSIKPGDTVELWNYTTEKPEAIAILAVGEHTFTYTFYSTLNNTQEISEDLFSDDWLEESLELVELYNSPLGRALA